MGLLKRGFKTWCENAAGGYRKRLGLDRLDPLDPSALAEHLGVVIKRPGEVRGLPKAVLHQLLVADHSSWSALTITLGSKSLIISNSSHSQARQNSNVAHELAHLILEHEPKKVFFSADGSMMLKDYNPTHEEEAACFSTTLLVPRDALLAALERSMSDAEAAAYFGVSLDLLRMRKNSTGIAKQLARQSA